MAGEKRRARLRALVKLAGIKQPDVDRFEQAFVHESAAAERQQTSNERLEFLGDAVLGLIISSWLYESFPDVPEGVLTKRKAAIVNDKALTETANRLGFAELVATSGAAGLRGDVSRTSILADAFEAFVAVLYLEHGLDAARTFVLKEHAGTIDVEQAAQADAKTELQELTQARLHCVPHYREHGDGPAHLRIFTSEVQVAGEVLGSGTGPSKKAAQQRAAAAALTILQERFGITHATQEN